MVDWRPTGSLAALQLRADALAAARRFFAARGVLEVETPILCRYPTTDVFIDSLRLQDNGDWLRTSPEHHMKRLLAAGAQDIYQIGKVFRAGERGARHEPEFTMAEWYRLNFDLDMMIAETCAFIAALGDTIGTVVAAPEVHPYTELFKDVTGCSPGAELGRLRTVAARAAGYRPELATQFGHDRSVWLDFIASHVVYPALPAGGLQVVRDYPAEQAMLAALKPGDSTVAERFEVFYSGVELGNGFLELRDSWEQRTRFVADNHRRETHGRAVMPIDEMLLGALTSGLPDCCGVAVGIDRVLLALSNSADIADTLSFRSGS